MAVKGMGAGNVEDPRNEEVGEIRAAEGRLATGCGSKGGA